MHFHSGVLVLSWFPFCFLSYAFCLTVISMSRKGCLSCSFPFESCSPRCSWQISFFVRLLGVTWRNQNLWKQPSLWNKAHNCSAPESQSAQRLGRSPGTRSRTSLGEPTLINMPSQFWQIQPARQSLHHFALQISSISGTPAQVPHGSQVLSFSS